MKKGKILILMTAVFLLLAAGISRMEPVTELDVQVNIPLSVTAVLNGQREQIRSWENEAGERFLFLPAGAELSDESMSQVALEESVQIRQSAGLPSLYLDVQSGSMDIIHETKGNRESGHLRLYNSDGTLAYSGPMESLGGRGNSSWLRAKKPYSLTLSKETDLLGMGQAKNWILLANAMDPSHLRNKVVYDLSAKAGAAYTPACRWVDLYLNGNYAGVYLLSERNEIHPQRLNFQETGSFLVSRESAWRLISQNYPRVLLDSGAALRVHDSGLTETDLYRIWQPVENAILAEDGVDPLTGKTWQELIDLDSWAMDYLAGEIFGNVDAGTISSYFYRDGADPTGRIFAGPVWDYDLSMGSTATWQTQTVRAFFGDKAHIWSLEDSTWFYGLNRKPEFQTRVKALYKDVYRPLLQELLETGLEQYARQISQAVELDQIRWGTENPWEETERLSQYLTERVAFLDSLWLENVEYCKVLVILDENSSSICHAVLPGETVPTLPGYEEAWYILGWYDAATEQPFDSTQPIYEDTVVYLKRIPGEEDQISPLQGAPIAAVLGLLACMILVDRKYRRSRKAGADTPVAKPENV